MRLFQTAGGLSTADREARAVRQHVRWRWTVVDSGTGLQLDRREVAHGYTFTLWGARRRARRAADATPPTRVFW